jgi:hypothetical protein
VLFKPAKMWGFELLVEYELSGQDDLIQLDRINGKQAAHIAPPSNLQKALSDSPPKPTI